jgi:hypothetical protein
MMIRFTRPDRRRDAHNDPKLRIFQTVYQKFSQSTLLKTFLLILLFGPPMYIALGSLISSGVRFHILAPVAEMRIITLDEAKDANNTSISGAASSSYSWRIDGWAHHENLESIISLYKVIGEDVMNGKLHDDSNERKWYWVAGERLEDPQNPMGYWMAKEKKLSNEDIIPVEDRHRMTLTNFQDPKRPSHFQIAIALYMEGEAELMINLYMKGEFLMVHRITMEGKQFFMGFCNEIISIRSGKFVDEV